MMTYRRTADLGATDRGYYIVQRRRTIAWPYVETLVIAGPYDDPPTEPAEPEFPYRFWSGKRWEAIE
jgi:hypothetical protein